MATIKGVRTRHVITLNPNKENPGEEFYIDIPKLKPDSCLVPGSLHLLYDFQNNNAKSWFLNNLSKLLADRLVVKLGGETVYDNSGESHLAVYRDLWRTKTDVLQAVEYDIAGENLNKLISKDDSGASSGDATKVSDGLMYTIHGTKQKLQLDRIIDDHGLYATYAMMNDFQYILTLPKATDMLAQSGSTIGTYALENLELEYETIDNNGIAPDVANYSSGRSFAYEALYLMKTTVWNKTSVLINENIYLPRKSM